MLTAETNPSMVPPQIFEYLFGFVFLEKEDCR